MCVSDTTMMLHESQLSPPFLDLQAQAGLLLLLSLLMQDLIEPKP